MDILFIPFNQKNPYQKVLARCLKDLGVDVILKDEASILPILRVVFSTGKPDILHLHWTHTMIKSRNGLERIIKGIRLFGEIILLKVAGVKIIWTVHNISDHDLEPNRIENLIHRYFAKLCDAIIVHCESAVQAIKISYKQIGSSRTKICVIPHGNYMKSYNNEISREKARKSLGLKDDELVFGFFGNIRTYKGVFNLVEAFKDLKEQRTRLLLVGKPDTADIEEKLKNYSKTDKRILLKLGFVPDNQIQIYMKCMDVVVLPFKKVLTSGSAFLAISYGKPVVAPDSGCLREMFGDNGNLLYEPEDSNSLIHAMKKCLKADLKKIGKHNLKLAIKADWKLSAKKTADVYSFVLLN
jgi:glycosyltransferase involved in cell wall biosynthesis